MKNPSKFPVFLILAFALSIASEHLLHAEIISHAAAQTAKQVTQKDFFGRWKLTASTVRKAPGEKEKPSQEQIADALEAQKANTAFLTSFDYLEFLPNGTYNWHQPGEPTEGKTVYSGKWTFKDGAMWLDTGAEPKLRYYPDENNMSMTYEAKDSDLFQRMYLYYFSRIK